MILTIAVKSSEIFIIKVIGKYSLTSHTFIVAFNYRIFLHVRQCAKCSKDIFLAWYVDRNLKFQSEDAISLGLHHSIQWVLESEDLDSSLVP